MPFIRKSCPFARLDRGCVFPFCVFFWWSQEAAMVCNFLAHHFSDFRIFSIFVTFLSVSLSLIPAGKWLPSPYFCGNQCNRVCPIESCCFRIGSLVFFFFCVDLITPSIPVDDHNVPIHPVFRSFFNCWNFLPLPIFSGTPSCLTMSIESSFS